MFEVISLGAAGWFRRRIKLRATKHMTSDSVRRSFEGYGSYSQQQYQLDIPQGSVVEIKISKSSLIEVGDQLSAATVDAAGALKPFWTMIKST